MSLVWTADDINLSDAFIINGQQYFLKVITAPV